MGRMYVESTPATRGEVDPEKYEMTLVKEQAKDIEAMGKKLDELQSENQALQQQVAQLQAELDTNPDNSKTVDVKEPGGKAKPEEPAGNASTEEWAAFAKKAGAKDEDLADKDGQPLGRDALRAKYGSSS